MRPHGPAAWACLLVLLAGCAWPGERPEAGATQDDHGSGVPASSMEPTATGAAAKQDPGPSAPAPLTMDAVAAAVDALLAAQGHKVD